MTKRAQPGDSVLVPEPTYPIHTYAMILAGANLTAVPLSFESDFFTDLVNAYEHSEPKPRVVLCSFPHNPTTAVVDLGDLAPAGAAGLDLDGDGVADLRLPMRG